MLPHLLFASPLHKLIPVTAHVYNTKAMNSIDCLIYDFQSGISLTHQALSNQVDAMAHMTWPNIHVDIFVGELFAIYGRAMVCPVTPTDIVLY